MRSGLPPDLTAALDRLSEGLSRTELRQRAAALSENYRAGGGSAAIRNEADALAYALVRMPATFAATSACLEAVATARPDFTPRDLIDVGAGPGTATWAAVQAFSSLDEFALVDANQHLRALALDLMRGCAKFRHVEYRQGSARAFLNGADDADLVIASYVVGELDDAERSGLAAQLWERTRDTLVLIEPGTPAGYQRIITLRAQLIEDGAHVIAPCPHDRACPLLPPDWCHFAVRLPRSRDHRLLKDADVPFEDEKFSYVALSRIATTERASRVLAPPLQNKAAITAKLCTDNDGVVLRTIARRDKPAYAGARRWRWGDTVKAEE
jgi:ribosomal protein RSM22 (predicted rRNA methylase)